ncbi:hypothetical protein L7F22_005928 [Adiantum nelumboides]|nr:hypothetical protein [Adiantum nelumboides]
MALPVTTGAANDEEDLIYGSEAAGYSQIPVDHLSDSSESSDSLSDDLAFYTISSQNLDAGMDHSSGGSPFSYNGESVAHGRSTGNGAFRNGGGSISTKYSAASHHNGPHSNVQEQMPNSSVLHNIRNGGRDLRVDHMQNHATDNGEHVVHFEGMEIHVYGQLAGLQLSAPPHHAHNSYGAEDNVDDIDETERQHEEDTAMRRVKEEEHAHRSAPLPPERCEAIKTAMESISLGGYRPEWADSIPEEQWLNRLRRK